MSETEMRELDGWIAENVFEYVRATSPNDKTNHNKILFWERPDTSSYNGLKYDVFFGEPYQIHGEDASYRHEWKFFHPTTDPAASMELLKKCEETDDVVIYKTVNERHGVKSDITEMAVDAETLELAIALFAKKLFSK